MSEYDPVTDDQWRAIKVTALAKIRARYEVLGFSPERIKTLMLQAEYNIMADMASFQLAVPKWLTPRRQRILSEIR